MAAMIIDITATTPATYSSMSTTAKAMAHSPLGKSITGVQRPKSFWPVEMYFHQWGKPKNRLLGLSLLGLQLLITAAKSVSLNKSVGIISYLPKYPAGN